LYKKGLFAFFHQKEDLQKEEAIPSHKTSIIKKRPSKYFLDSLFIF